MSENKVHSLNPFHVLTGNDYFSSFFRKGKLHFWKILEKSKRFLAAIQQLGTTWELPSCTLQQVPAYVCALYGNTNSSSVNELRTEMFDKNT